MRKNARIETYNIRDLSEQEARTRGGMVWTLWKEYQNEQSPVEIDGGDTLDTGLEFLENIQAQQPVTMNSCYSCFRVDGFGRCVSSVPCHNNSEWIPV